MNLNSEAKTVSEAVNTRRSLRAFLSSPVPESLIREILVDAARAPSGTNMQPWKVYVLTGDARQRLCDTVSDAFDTEWAEHDSEVRYYPEKWFEPYISRRRKVGWDLYRLLGIEKGERDKTRQQHRRNFQFFDAPVGMIFSIDRDLSTGSWLDYGMFLQNIMLLARENGLDSCPQAAWADYHRAIRPVISLPADEVVVCGMAIGYADTRAIENSLITERESLNGFATFLK
ncbi:MAG: nitroreductase [Acidiferrobacterales bacterium]|nr:nitroreductase [Acidiferrobacterales bacterium]